MRRTLTALTLASLTSIALLACSKDQASSGPAASASAAPSSSAPPVAAAVGSNTSAAAEGMDPKAPVLSVDDASYADPRKGFGWSDRCFTEIKQGKLGFARAACDRALALPDLDSAARPSLLFNEGLISKKAGDTTAARNYFIQSLNLRPAGEPGRPTVEKELESVGGKVPPAPAPTGKLECRTKSGAQTVELYLDWQQNTARGWLRETLPSGGMTTQAVAAELYKGLILVDHAGTAAPLRGKLATLQTDPKKTIQLGDAKQPALACD